MHDHTSNSHKLLTQIPLTVSPFAKLPTPLTLPYDYISLPASLPPPSSNLIVSPSGQSSTTPEQLIAEYQKLSAHLTEEVAKAKEAVEEWEKGIKERELMEKRRVAPGWLDTGVMMLEPTKKVGSTSPPPNAGGGASGQGGGGGEQKVLMPGGAGEGKPAVSPGEELDKAFGGLSMWK